MKIKNLTLLHHMYLILIFSQIFYVLHWIKFPNIFLINNNNTQVLPIKPFIISCENNGDIITNRPIKYNIIQFHYIGNKHQGYIDNNFFISLFGNKSESYPILKPPQQIEISSYFNIYNDNNLLIDCTNCDGANLIGLTSNSIVSIIKILIKISTFKKKK
ncbi:hypothetical protein ACTFIR_009913 [Dictyostelium discoideum]